MLTLDHVGFIVPDLDTCAALVSDLGFVLTPRAGHTRTLPSGETVSAGSAQRSLMLARGYIEFMEIFDPAAGHMLADAGSDRYGLHILALGTPDAPASQADCQHSGAAVGPVMDWSRPLEGAGAGAVARFRFFGATDWTPSTPSYLCWVQHLTPDLLRPAALVQHANGALALEAIRYRGDPGWDLALRAAGAPASVSVWPAEGPARATDITLRFAELDPICDAARRCGVSVERDADGAWLDLREPLGLRWRCVLA